MKIFDHICVLNGASEKDDDNDALTSSYHRSHFYYPAQITTLTKLYFGGKMKKRRGVQGEGGAYMHAYIHTYIHTHTPGKPDIKLKKAYWRANGVLVSLFHLVPNK